MYSLYICIYSDVHPFTLTKLYIYIYVYIYAAQDQIHRAQAIGALGSYSQHAL